MRIFATALILKPMVKSLILATFILSLSACSPAANNSSTGDVSTTEGIFDPQFYENMGTGFNGAVTSLARDGKDNMIVGGEFLKFKGTTAGGIA